jgi:uncharacterized protein
MKRMLVLTCMVLFFSWTCIAQTSAADSPASKEDVEKVFQVMHSHDMMKKMMATMAQSIHQMTHQQYLKDKDNLPADYESKMTGRMDDMLANMPMDEMMQAMVPAYQKHFTKGDMDNLVAFYSSPTGEKLLREMPAIMAEAMQDMMPIMTKYTETVKQTLLKETDDMIAQSKKQRSATAPTANN